MTWDLDILGFFDLLDLAKIPVRHDDRTRWHPAVLAGFSKQSTHLALDDIRDSVTELRYYRSTVFAAPGTVAERLVAARVTPDPAS